MSPYPYSLILPEGGRVACRRSFMGALVDARTTNASRVARGIAPVKLLNRDTGETWDVPGDADCLAIADARPELR